MFRPGRQAHLLCCPSPPLALASPPCSRGCSNSRRRGGYPVDASEQLLYPIALVLSYSVPPPDTSPSPRALSSTTALPAAAAAAAALPANEPGHGTCAMCREAPRQSVIFPCGHHALCIACTLELSERHAPGQRLCPCCRGAGGDSYCSVAGGCESACC